MSVGVVGHDIACFEVEGEEAVFELGERASEGGVVDAVVEFVGVGVQVI